MKKTVDVALIQMSCGEDQAKNFERAVERITEAANSGAKIVCTHELFKSRYFCQTIDNNHFDFAEEINENNATIKTLSKLASRLKIVIIASLFEKRAPGLYHNTAVVLDADGSFLGKYRKMHIPEDPFYHEKHYFTPGDLGYRVFKTKYANIGVLICWDQWFPEAARLTAMQGAEIIFYPTAIGYVPGERESAGTSTFDAWDVIQRSHAVANGCYVACANRVGFEKNPENEEGITFWGQSFVSNPHGKIMGRASENQDDTLLCTVDLAEIETFRNRLGHFFRDRRSDSYADLSRRFLDND
jgi:N-carbamoylputrescine amidase